MTGRTYRKADSRAKTNVTSTAPWLLHPAEGTAPRASLLESALIERVRSGEAHLFGELISPHARRVYRAAISVMHNEADAQEVAQEAYLKAFTHLRRFRAQARFSTWLVRIALNTARSKRRKDRKALFESMDAIVPDGGEHRARQFAAPGDTPVEALQRGELRRALRNAVAVLDASHRDVFILRDVQKLSIAETAALLGVSEPLVKSRLLRARLRLRELLLLVCVF